MASRIGLRRLAVPARRRALAMLPPPQKPYFLVTIPDKPGTSGLRKKNRPPAQPRHLVKQAFSHER